MKSSSQQPEGARALAGEIAAKLLRECIRGEIGLAPTPLETIARKLHAEISLEPPSAVLADGTVSPHEQLDFFRGETPGLRIRVSSSGARRRFTIAHELAHCAADRFLGVDEVRSWDARHKKYFLDQLASRLLVPDAALRAAVSSSDGAGLALTPQWLSASSRQLDVSLSALVNRLHDARRDSTIEVHGCAIVASRGLSSARRTNYGVRIDARCTPPGWYIPVNKRLRSMGMHQLAAAYHRSPRYRISRIEDRLRVSRTFDWREFEVRTELTYVVFDLQRDGESVLLATFDLPDEEMTAMQ